MYVLGACMHWRTAAWLCGGTPLLSLALTYAFCRESPLWLVAAGRRDQALASLRYYARRHPSAELRVRLSGKY